MKLTEEQREKAKKELVERLTRALEETPRGISDGEIWECIGLAANGIGILEGQPQFKG